MIISNSSVGRRRGLVQWVIWEEQSSDSFIREEQSSDSFIWEEQSSDSFIWDQSGTKVSRWQQNEGEKKVS